MGKGSSVRLAGTASALLEGIRAMEGAGSSWDNFGWVGGHGPICGSDVPGMGVPLC